MWFKKKSVLLAEGNYNTEKSADNTTDLRTTYKTYNNNNSSIKNFGIPSATEANNYFYLPALGTYSYPYLLSVGQEGDYWSSSSNPWSNGNSYCLYFFNNGVGVKGSNPSYGQRVEPLFQ